MQLFCIVVCYCWFDVVWTVGLMRWFVDVVIIDDEVGVGLFAVVKVL